MEKVIVAQFVADWVMPYASDGTGIAEVIYSTHPEYKFGCRLDFGFLAVALAQGYNVLILSTGKPMTEIELEVYGEAEPNPRR